MSNDLRSALQEHQAAFGLGLTLQQIDRLTAYYDLIQQHNPLLHLVGPSTAEEFAVRHILESLTLLAHLPENAKLADVGTGAGLPSVPCLLVRDDLTAALIESKEKKAAFLTEAVSELGLKGRAELINKQYAEFDLAGYQFVTCRALDKFTEKLPHLVRWSGRATLLLFGGENVGSELGKFRPGARRELMPLSERRFLFIAAP